MKDLHAKKRNTWTSERLKELEDKIENAGKAKKMLCNLQLSETKYSQQRLQQMQKRTATKLLEENRVKRRRLRVDYQPLFGKMSPHSSPERAAGRVRFPLLV